MIYFIFDSTGSLIDVFSDPTAALYCLAGAAEEEPEAAADIVLIAQDNDGNTACETIYAAYVLTAAQIDVVGRWTERGPDLVTVVVHAAPPSYAREWETGDVIATQGDAFVHVGSGGAVKDAVPPRAHYPE